MGRELKRVPLDFDWPLDTPWSGYVNPHYCATNCEKCNGTGLSPTGQILSSLWYGFDSTFRQMPLIFNPAANGSTPYISADPIIREIIARKIDWSVKRDGRENNWYYKVIWAHSVGETDEIEASYREDAITAEANRMCEIYNQQWSHHLNQDDVNALIDGGRLYDFTHIFTKGNGWKPAPFITPTANDVNYWNMHGFGHDSINQWLIVKARCEKLGMPYECDHCKGETSFWPSKEAEELYNNWTRTEPPEGKGYQIWETVSEGSPISPVFATPLELAKHMATTKWGADEGQPVEKWFAFIEGPGWAPSLMVSTNSEGEKVLDTLAIPDKYRKKVDWIARTFLLFGIFFLIRLVYSMR